MNYCTNKPHVPISGSRGSWKNDLLRKVENGCCCKCEIDFCKKMFPKFYLVLWDWFISRWICLLTIIIHFLKNRNVRLFIYVFFFEDVHGYGLKFKFRWWLCGYFVNLGFSYQLFDQTGRQVSLLLMPLVVITDSIHNVFSHFFFLFLQQH